MNPIAHKQIAARSEEVKEILRSCALCPRQCGADRISGEKGYCGLDGSVRCFREMLHTAEEQELNPSHQIYFAGCNLRCEFCSVAEWNEDPQEAEQLDIDELSEKIADRRARGARTLNLLGGEPTVNIYGILQLLANLEPSTKVVLNSNMYYDGRLNEIMEGLVDIYLADLKCGASTCAKTLLDAPDYIEAARENILSAYGRADVIVRHLILPGHRKCCLEPTLEWIADNLPDVKLSLRDNYAPPASASSAPMGYVGPNEMHEAVLLAEEMNLHLVQ